MFTQGSPLPIMDEWDLLAKTGDGHLTFGWMIQHHGEHRFPLPKLLWLTALRVTGYDFRAVMFVTLTLLVAASILLMWTARRVRGLQHPADALFPALLLHWGHGFNFIMSFQLGFALFLPFIIIDIVVSSVLMSMGMFMLPPAMIALPFKLLLFVLVDGWTLLMQSLVASFR